MAQRLNATLILDAVGGNLGRQLLELAPAPSTWLMYANLSGETLALDPHTLWGEDKHVAGFYLGNWAAKKSMLRTLGDIRRVQQLAATDLQSTIQKRLPLFDVQQAIEVYRNNPTAGKVLLIADSTML